MIIYRFLYCGCIHESAHATISIHKTKEGAIKAMDTHKAFKLIEFNDMFGSEEDKEKYSHMNFGTNEDWATDQIELKE